MSLVLPYLTFQSLTNSVTACCQVHWKFSRCWKLSFYDCSEATQIAKTSFVTLFRYYTIWNISLWFIEFMSLSEWHQKRYRLNENSGFCRVGVNAHSPAPSVPALWPDFPQKQINVYSSVPHLMFRFEIGSELYAVSWRDANLSLCRQKRYFWSLTESSNINNAWDKRK